MAGQQVASAAAVRRVGGGFLHLNGNKVLVVLSNGPGAHHEAAHEEVPNSRDALQVLHHVVRVRKDVVVAVEQEMYAGTADLQPLQEEHLLQRQVQEGFLEVPLEDVFVLPLLKLHELVQRPLLKVFARRPQDEHPADPDTVVQPLLGPGLPEDLSPVVVLRLGLDDQQEEDVQSVHPATFVGKVEKQGEVFTVLVVQEILEAIGELREASDVDHGQVPMAWRPEVERMPGGGRRSLVAQVGVGKELNIFGEESWRLEVEPEKDPHQAQGHHEKETFNYPCCP